MFVEGLESSRSTLPPVHATFGSYVREVRERAGVRIAAMAQRIGVSSAHYNRVELNDKVPPDAARWSPLIDLGADRALLELLAAKFRAERDQGKRSRYRSERDVIAAGQPGSSSWDDLPWEEDDWCWYAVTCHPDGLTTEEVAAITGLTSERVRQIEQEALAKLAVEPDAIEAMEIIDDRENERAIWTVVADMRYLESRECAGRSSDAAEPSASEQG